MGNLIGEWESAMVMLDEIQVIMSTRDRQDDCGKLKIADRSVQEK
jgi:hypothetical protein